MSLALACISSKAPNKLALDFKKTTRMIMRKLSSIRNELGVLRHNKYECRWTKIDRPYLANVLY